MATTDDNRGVRLQAERVVRAYKALREAPKNSDTRDDIFPIGLFAELLQQLKQLEGWLEPADPDDLHEQTVAEIREEYRDADEREIKLRAAIRESFGATRDEEEAAFDRIIGAMQS